MDKNRSQNRLIYPSLILAMALVCAGLIVYYLWSNVNQVVVFPWEGPTPTPTLWWRSAATATPKPTDAPVGELIGTPAPPASAALPVQDPALIVEAPFPAGGVSNAATLDPNAWQEFVDD